MAKVALNPEQRRELIRILSLYGRVDSVSRRPHFYAETGLDEAIPDRLPMIPLDGAAHDFAQSLVTELQQVGTLPQTQQPALVLVLRYLRHEVRGHEQEAAFLDGLLAPYSHTTPDKPLNLFISYRRKSWVFAQRLAEQLKQSLNADIFIDLTGVDESNFERAILRNLRAADAVLLVVSEHTFSERIHQPDDWVRREIAGALRLNKPITLVAVDGLFPPPPDQLPPDIADIGKMQGVRFYPEPELWDGALRRLANFLRVVAPSSSSARERPVEPVTSVPTPATSLPQLYASAMGFLENEEWDRALVLLGDLVARGYRPRFVVLDDLIADATRERNAAIRRREMLDDYGHIALLARAKATHTHARAAFKRFLEDYPDFEPTDDNAGLATLLAPPAKPTLQPARANPPLTPKITPEQQRLLDIMQDMRRPVPERAEAGCALAKIGDPRPGVGLRPDGLPDIVWCPVPAGEYSWQDGKATLEYDYYIAKYPLTYAQYQLFIDAKGYEQDKWWEGLTKPEPQEQRFQYSNHPRDTITWWESVAYARWLSAQMKVRAPGILAHNTLRVGERAMWEGIASGTLVVTLPTEEEWEKAARENDGRAYPWGSDYISGYANIDETYKRGKVGPYYLQQTSAVGIYPSESASPYGVMDMAGNVWEWTLSAWDEKEKVREQQRGWTLHNAQAVRVVRGGSWYFDHLNARAAFRYGNLPYFRYYFCGVRLCLAPAPARSGL